MTEVTENPNWIYVTHDDIRFEFEKLGNDTVRYRFAKTTAGPPNNDRTDRYDVEDIPNVVMDRLASQGYAHL